MRAAMALSPRRWPALVHCLAVALLVEACIRSVELPRLARLVGVPLRLGPNLESGAAVLSWSERERSRLDLAVRLMRHWPWGNTCLRNALVVGHVVRRRRPRLRVGVALVDGEVHAHAWLEIDGANLDPTGSAEFTPLEAVNGG